MELTKLINSVRAIQVSGQVERKDISSITSDSRKVKKGCLFVAIKGLVTDGHNYVLDAISKGAITIVLDKDIYPDEIFLHRNVTKIFVKDSRVALAELSHYFYKEPTLDIKLIGITGTNGKTTTAWLLRHVLQYAGSKTGMIGTIANYIDDVPIPTLLTTPESNDLCEMLYNMKLSGCDYVAMEVSSHALVLNRVHGLRFASAIFTNLTLDHLDYHRTFEAYRDAKKTLFDNLSNDSIAVINADDSNARYMVKNCSANIYTYGTNGNADFQIKDLRFNLAYSEFTIEYKGIDYQVATKLVGTFNASNITAAFAVALLNGISTTTIINAIAVANHTPGRFESYTEGEKTVIIDYSHTPDSLEKALQNIRLIVGTSNPIVTVFGCGGNRDKSKRPLMGKIASELSNSVIVTSDNPRMENPASIIHEIVEGMDKPNYKVIEDRKEAIADAICNSPANAVILLAGKGHEVYQIIGETKIHLSDKEEALAALQLKEPVL